MSKYIDAERLNMEWQTLKPFGVTDTMIENLKWIVDRQPTIEVSDDCISEFRDYQIEWLTGHCDIELEPVLEDLIVRFLKDTAEIFIKENAPSVVPTVRKNRQVERAEGKWIVKQSGFAECSVCEQHSFGDYNYCPFCGAKMCLV